MADLNSSRRGLRVQINRKFLKKSNKAIYGNYTQNICRVWRGKTFAISIHFWWILVVKSHFGRFFVVRKLEIFPFFQPVGAQDPCMGAPTLIC